MLDAGLAVRMDVNIRRNTPDGYSDLRGLTERQVAAMGEQGKVGDGGRPVTVVMNITTPDAGAFRRSQGQIAAEAARAMDRARRNL